MKSELRDSHDAGCHKPIDLARVDPERFQDGAAVCAASGQNRWPPHPLTIHLDR